jgi:hypothetical protein
MRIILGKSFLVSLEKSLTARDLNLQKAVSVDDNKHTGHFDPDNKGSRFPAMSAHPYAISRCRIQERINLVVTSPTAVSVAYSLFLYYTGSSRSHRISLVTDCRLFN